VAIRTTACLENAANHLRVVPLGDTWIAGLSDQLRVHGSTLGKLVLSMVVVQEDGSLCRLKGAVVRSMGYLLDALFSGLVGYSAMQKTSLEQRHGDEWAHTVVCKCSNAPPGSLRGGGRFVMAWFFAIMADAGADHCRTFVEVARMIVPMGFRSWVASNRQTNEYV
jgi:hypothetical protein